VGQVANLRRVVNPPEFARLAIGAQDSILPHKPESGSRNDSTRVQYCGLL
jgi:hypothetical protein